MVQHLINPKIVKWAREKNNYTQTEAAQKCGVVLATYMAWEDGSKDIPPTKLPTLSRIFKYTSALFLLDKLPDEKYPIEFRKYFMQFGIEQSKELYTAIRSALLTKDNLKELIGGTENIFLKKIGKLKNKATDEITEGLIRYLGIDKNIYLSLSNEFRLFKYWKNAVESQGIAVMEMGFPQSEARSFVIYDKTSPIIVLNTKDSVHSKMFSLFHEVGHLVFSHSSIDNEITLNGTDSAMDIEIVCNRIASNILVDKIQLKKEIRLLHTQDILTTVLELSKKFKVSREVIAYKLQEIDYYSRQDIDEYISTIKQSMEQVVKRHGGGNYYKNIVINKSPLFLSTAFESFSENRITFSKLVEYIKVKAEKINKLETTVMTYYD